MKCGFTLIEIIIVIIIVGILGALGISQYSKTVEKGRGAEARVILGDIRKLAMGYQLQYGSVVDIPLGDLNIGISPDQIPSACTGTHYFSYSINSSGHQPNFWMIATRCTSGGKEPQGSVADTLILISNLATGVDSWSGTGDY